MDVPTADDAHAVLGVTITVPDPWASQIRQIRSDAGDPLARTIVPHITLVPPVLIAKEDVPAVLEHVRAVAGRGAPFVVEMARSQTFRPVSPVVYLELARGADALGSLHDDLRSAGGPLAGPPRFPFHPHITLAHGVADGALDEAATAGDSVRGTFLAQRISVHCLVEDGSWVRLEAPELIGR